MSNRVKRNSALAAFVAIAAVFVVSAVAWQPYIQPMVADWIAGGEQLAGVIPGVTTTTTTTTIAGQCQPGPNAPIALDKTWKITFTKNTGGDIGASTDTVNIYDIDSLSVFDPDLDPSAAGIVTTAKTFSSGDTYHAEYVNTTGGTTKQWFNNLAVPFHCVDTDSNHISEVESFQIGTYVYTITYSGNTTAIPSGDAYNYTTAGTTPSFTVRIDNTADNTGYLSSSNPITGRPYKPVLLIVVNGTGFNTVTMKSANFNQDGAIKNPQYVSTVTSRIWMIELTEDNLSRMVRTDGTVVNPGTTSISFQLNLAGVSVDTADMYVQLAGYSSTGEVVQFESATTNDGVTLKDHLVNIVG